MFFYFEESYEGVIKDHPELKEIKVKHRNKEMRLPPQHYV